MRLQDIELEMDKLSLADGDVVVLRFPDLIPIPELDDISARLRKYMDEHGHQKVLFLAMPKDYGIEQLTSKDMAELGWKRIGAA